MSEGPRRTAHTGMLSPAGGKLLQSNEALAEHLRDERDLLARTLDMYRTGQMSFMARNVDITANQMTDLLGVINAIDQLLERMAAQGSGS